MNTSTICIWPRRCSARFCRNLLSALRSRLVRRCRLRTLLGGDYYDFFQISDNVVDVVIADVSGHGAAASLLMPSLAVALRLRARELEGPAAIIKDLDQVFRQITGTATFVTMFYARFDQAGKTLEYANGGHNPPLLIRAKNGEARELEAGGPILGILQDSQYSNTVVALNPGDILTLFTDGVTEQENEAGDEFSTSRLKEVVIEPRDRAGGCPGRLHHRSSVHLCGSKAAGG